MDSATTRALRARAIEVEARVRWLIGQNIPIERIKRAYDIDCPMCQGAGAVRLFAEDQAATSPCQLCPGVEVLPG
jgi:hypothetical protein